MNKNVKSIFFVATLLILLVGVSAISASEVSDDTTVILDTADTVAQEVTTTTTDNKIVETPTKNVKKEETTTDLYVSDTTGSDENSGTIDSPYKTLQKALDTTNADSTFNIHIAEGTYKGLGNTNLTVNGNYNINFIGDGINKTVIDGEANYTILGGDVWGSDPDWNTYIIEYGNWGLNISEGTGLITIKNLNIQHMISEGPKQIAGWKTATIDNHANLIVDNIYFYSNMAGVGAGIRNNNNSSLTVTNTIFEANRKSNTMGNYGAAIYNNGTAIVEDSQFIHNYARWGTITNDRLINITNCVFRDGVSYDLGSTYKMGCGIVTNTEYSDYFTHYSLFGLKTIIENCSFINNSQADIYQGNAELIVNNCNFINSTGIYMDYYENNSVDINITNNNFTNMRVSSIFGNLNNNTGTTFAIYSQAAVNTLIQNNTINFTNNGYGIYARNSTIRNNNMTHIIYANANNTIQNNSINTEFAYAIEVAGQNNIITDNNLVANVFTGDKSVKTRTSKNTVENNSPTMGDEINLTNDNYNNYFNDEGIILNDVVANGTTINIASDLFNKNIILNNTRVALYNPDSNILYNTSITINKNSKSIVDGININNTNNNNHTLLIEADNILIQNSNIYINTSSNAPQIIINGKQTTLTKNTINIEYNSNNDIKSVIIESDDNFIQNNIDITHTTSSGSGRLTGVQINNATGNEIMGTIRVNKANNAVGITLNSSDNNIIHQVDVNAKINATGIHMYNSDSNSIKNFNINSNNTCIGVVITGDKTTTNNKITISGSKINAVKITGITAENTKNLEITGLQSTSKFTGNDTGKLIQIKDSINTQIKYIRLMIGNTTESKTIELINTNNTQIENIYTNNQITLNNSHNNSIITVDDLVKNYKIISDNTAITLENSDYNNMTDLHIYTKTHDTILLKNSNNNNISNNYLNGNNETCGNQTIIQINSQNNILENNTPLKFEEPVSITLTDENYDEYFTNQQANEEITEIILGSDLYNKNMIFTHNLKFINNDNYTIYNTTIYNNAEINITNIIINTTDDRVNIINNTGNLKFTGSSIYQENKENIALTVYNTGVMYMPNSITVIAPATQSINDTTTLITNEGKLYNIHSINLTTVGEGGVVNLINSDENQSLTTIGPSNITVNTQHNLTLNAPIYAPASSNITLIANNINMTVGKFSNIQRDNILIKTNKLEIAPLYGNMRKGAVAAHIMNNSIILDTTEPVNFSIMDELCFINITNNNITSNNELQIKLHNIVTTKYHEIASGIIIGSSNITNNNITVNQTTPIITINNSANMTIKDNYLYTNFYKANEAVIVENSTNIRVSKNTPATIITNDNYDEFFTDGTYTHTQDYIEFAEDVYNKNMTFNKAITINNTNNPTFYNTTITLNSQYENILSNVNLKNTDDRTSSIIINGNTTITNSTIYHENTENNGETIIITFETNGTVNITQTNITTVGNNTAITSQNARVNIANNMINQTGTNIQALNINNIPPQYTNSIKSNTILAESDNPSTAIYISYPNKMINLPISNNVILLKTYQNTTSIINIANNTGMLTQIQNNYIESYDTSGLSTINYTGQARVSGNMPTTTGYKSQIQNIILPDTILVNKEIEITINITDALDRPITGTITLTDGETTITSESNIINYTPTTDGEKTLTITYSDPTGKYNTANTTLNITVNPLTILLTVNPITATIGETINITARITANDETIEDLNKGKVTFKVKGKTLKDANGKVIYAKVVNGVATIENYLVPDDWTKEGTTIQAVYSGSTDCEKLTSEKTDIVIIADEATLTASDITATAGSSITLTATITDNDKIINTGKIVFKINGKTVKDASGKVIYAKVVNNTVSVEYTLPADLKAKDYNITATFISSDYDKLEDTKTLTITA